MTKYINFIVAETSCRTFEVPMEKVKELLKRTQEEVSSYEDSFEVDLSNDHSVAQFLTNYCLDDIAENELDNDYYEINLVGEDFIGED